MNGAELLQDGALTVPAAAAFSGWGRTYLYDLMGKGQLAYIAGPGRTRRIPKRALLDLMAAHLQGGQAAQA